MGIMVYSLLWLMQDFVHQPYYYFSRHLGCGSGLPGLGAPVSTLNKGLKSSVYLGFRVFHGRN